VESKKESKNKNHNGQFAIMLRSSTQLQGPKGARVEVKSKNDHDEDVSTLPSKAEVQEKSENKSSKEFKSFSSKLDMLPTISTKIC